MATRTALVFLFLALPLALQATPTCMDDNNSAVDWWIMLKAPKYLMDDNTSEGVNYGYLDSNNASSFSWDKDNSVNSNSALSYTIAALNSEISDLGFAVYNDSVPGDQEYYDFAHMKGFIASDSTQGAYIMHSFPKYPLMNNDGTINPEVQSGQLWYGQYAACFTVSSDSANTIAQALTVSNPKVYAGQLPLNTQGLEKLGELIDREKRQRLVGVEDFADDEAKTHVQVSTVGGESLQVVAHNKSLDTDYFEDVLSPFLKTGFLVESWGRPYMNSYCDKSFTEENILKVKATDYFYWESHEDHSKWSVSADSSSPYVCMNDNNRMTSQRERGGGSTCFSNGQLYSVFKNIIDDYYKCESSDDFGVLIKNFLGEF